MGESRMSSIGCKVVTLPEDCMLALPLILQILVVVLRGVDFCVGRVLRRGML